MRYFASEPLRFDSYNNDIVELATEEDATDMVTLTIERACAFLDAFMQAWLKVDADAAIALISQDFRYWWDPTKAPVTGHDAYREYWLGEGGIQQELDIRWRDPLVSGNSLAVEIWVTMHYAGAEISDPKSAENAQARGTPPKNITSGGCTVFDFNEQGLCREMREYRFVSDGTFEAPEAYRNRAIR